MNTFINLNQTNQNNIRFDKPGDYVVFFYNLSGKFIFDIQTSGVNVDIFGLYIGKKHDEFVIHTIQNHEKPNSKSNMLIKGVFYDNSKFQYSGLVRIQKNAQKSIAYQKNQNLLISKNVFVESKPYLEILADDVFCTHGSTTGQINNQQLEYIESRGIKKKEAAELIVKGFINDIINKIKIGYPKFDYLFPKNL